MTDAKIVYVGLGSNLGDRKQNIDKALEILAQTDNIELLRISEVVETAPLAGDDQPNYLNTVSEIKTSLSAQQLHSKTLAIETGLGRTRNVKWSPRTIDLDILFFGDEIISQPSLTIPHPQLHLRSFVLKGLNELSPALEHPVMKVSIQQLFSRLNGCDFIPNADSPKLISVAGIIGVGKTTLAQRLASLIGGALLLEPYDKNPFMPEVYAGKTDLALDSQLFFLTHRLEQLAPDVLQNQKTYITDYIFEKELIYANRQLNQTQLDLYYGIYNSLSSKVTAPVLAIYLTDTVQSCLDRIHSRNRRYEQAIELTFLDALNSDYQRLFSQWKTSPVIRIDASQLDNENDSYFEHLIKQIKCYIDVKVTPQLLSTVKA
jgi:deoxyguanosine kinase